MNGKHPAGRIGGDSMSALIQRARHDPKIDALVLRVNSGGGSALASEIIRREVELTRKAGKPVVVSMSSVAASGGYWIAVSADEIWAMPTTITGSIGIFAAMPTIERSLDALGIHTDGVGTTRLAGAFDITRPLNPLLSSLLQRSIERGYRQFILRVSEGRRLEPATVEEIAQGRVWAGETAYELGLVDALGGLDDALQSAASLAELDTFDVVPVEAPQTTRERLIKSSDACCFWSWTMRLTISKTTGVICCLVHFWGMRQWRQSGCLMIRSTPTPCVSYAAIHMETCFETDLASAALPFADTAKITGARAGVRSAPCCPLRTHALLQ